MLPKLSWLVQGRDGCLAPGWVLFLRSWGSKKSRPRGPGRWGSHPKSATRSCDMVNKGLQPLELQRFMMKLKGSLGRAECRSPHKILSGDVPRKGLAEQSPTGTGGVSREGSRVWRIGVQVLPFTSCVVWGKLLALSLPQLFHL